MGQLSLEHSQQQGRAPRGKPDMVLVSSLEAKATRLSSGFFYTDFVFYTVSGPGGSALAPAGMLNPLILCWGWEEITVLSTP